MMALARAPIVSYARVAVGWDSNTWPDAGHVLLEELAGQPGRFALVADDSDGGDRLVAHLEADLGLGVVHVGRALADRVTAPTLDELELAVDNASVLTDLDLLFWPDLGVPVLPFLADLARRRPIIAVWPGEIAAGRARYGVPGRPDHQDERLTDVVVLHPRSVSFPDEIPYQIERIPR
jgi:hypothetical protein